MASAKVIKALNDARARELTAILQYLSQHYELADQDYAKLGDAIKKVGIVEMKHAELLAERVLFLGGVPTSAPDGKAKKGEEIPGMLATDIKLEADAVVLYNKFAKLCAEESDQVSKELFDKLVTEEEDHFNYFDNVKDHVDKLGAAYLATLAG
jgi:bacterioferritin